MKRKRFTEEQIPSWALLPSKSTVNKRFSPFWGDVPPSNRSMLSERILDTLSA